MSMDLWYDLAARELPDLDGAIIERFQGTDAVQPVEEEESEPLMPPVDFF
jgi:hypothetical protein